VRSVTIASEVQRALDQHRPVVAMESTVYSTLGLPSHAGAEALERSQAACAQRGVTAAITAVVDGVATVGVSPADYPRLHSATTKVAERDLAVALADQVEFGATTVSASLALAAQAGIGVFATGGIGGVHRDVAESGDVSADLGAIARHPVVTVCSGAKAFLDLGRTLEHLEMLSVPVLGWQTHEFPAFYAHTSGLRLAHRVEGAIEVAAVHRARLQLGGGGTVLAVPVPSEFGLEHAELEDIMDRAQRSAVSNGVVGPAITPHVLGTIAAATDGRAVAANVELVVHNAEVAADVAVALAAAPSP
jgi:pseudouridine-5'-phosphate glycosidase